ncbi:MAG: RNA methyltransferase [Fibrobacteria bacterium]|nr:RNA methyltransferase [Fibrobacteria bacterium]
MNDRNGNQGRGGASRGQGGRGGRSQGAPDWKRRPRAAAPKAVIGESTAVYLDEELRGVADLRYDRGRERAGQYLVEGVRAVETLLDRARENVVAVYETDGVSWNRSLMDKGPGRIPLRKLTEGEMENISSTKTQQGLVAVAAARSLRVNWETARRVTLVDGVQDPGNLGALFRSCAAFGFDALVLGKGTVDPWNPRAARGSAGLVATVPFEAGVNLQTQLDFLRQKGFTILGTSPHGKDTIDSVKLKNKVAFLVGNEGKGASQNLLDQCDAKVRIPMSAGVESLNVAVAHGILCSGLYLRS